MAVAVCKKCAKKHKYEYKYKYKHKYNYEYKYQCSQNVNMEYVAGKPVTSHSSLARLADLVAM